MRKKLCFFFLTMFPLFHLTDLSGKEIEITIWNGTRSRVETAEKVDIFLFTEEGIQLHRTISEPTRFFRYSVEPGYNNPVLVRAFYLGEPYGEIINLNETSSNLIQKKVYVYEKTKDLNGLNLHVGMQITKYEKTLEINYIYAIQNKTNPPVTILPDEVELFLPKNAKILNATISYEKSRIPQKVEVTPKENSFYAINKSLKPGNTEIVIQVEIDGFTFENQIDPLSRRIKDDSASFFQVIMWRPDAIKPKLQGGTLEEKQVQELGKVYLLHYEKPEVLLDFSEGPVLYKDPMKAFYNPVFDTPLKTTLALFIGVTILFLLTSIFSTSGRNIQSA